MNEDGYRFNAKPIEARIDKLSILSKTFLEDVVLRIGVFWCYITNCVISLYRRQPIPPYKTVRTLYIISKKYGF